MKDASELNECMSFFQNELCLLDIHCKIKGWHDEFGTYIEVEAKDLNLVQKDQLLSLRKRHEKLITESKPQKIISVPQVDYINIKFTFSVGYKQKVWSWMQKQFIELSSLPKNVYELESYHKAKHSKICALQILEEALNSDLALSTN